MSIIVSVKTDEVVQVNPDGNYFRLSPSVPYSDPKPEDDSDSDEDSNFDDQQDEIVDRAVLDQKADAITNISPEGKVEQFKADKVEDIILETDRVQNCTVTIVKDLDSGIIWMLHNSPKSLMLPYDVKTKTTEHVSGEFFVRNPAYTHLDPTFYKDKGIGINKNARIEVTVFQRGCSDEQQQKNYLEERIGVKPLVYNRFDLSYFFENGFTAAYSFRGNSVKIQSVLNNHHEIYKLVGSKEPEGLLPNAKRIELDKKLHQLGEEYPKLNLASEKTICVQKMEQVLAESKDPEHDFAKHASPIFKILAQYYLDEKNVEKSSHYTERYKNSIDCNNSNVLNFLLAQCALVKAHQKKMPPDNSDLKEALEYKLSEKDIVHLHLKIAKSYQACDKYSEAETYYRNALQAIKSPPRDYSKGWRIRLPNDIDLREGSQDPFVKQKTQECELGLAELESLKSALSSGSSPQQALRMT